MVQLYPSKKKPCVAEVHHDTASDHACVVFGSWRRCRRVPLSALHGEEKKSVGFDAEIAT